MNERTDVITFKGNPLTLVGPELTVGQAAPEFKAVANDLSEVELASYRGKVVVISCVPSLDTPVCDAQTRRFNAEATNLGDHIAVLTISLDLPFAQKRWCGASGVEKVVTVSDYKAHEFGSAYGLYIKELGLLTRAVLVLDPEGVLRYVQIVPEVTDEPDYESVLQAIKGVV